MEVVVLEQPEFYSTNETYSLRDKDGGVFEFQVGSAGVTFDTDKITGITRKLKFKLDENYYSKSGSLNTGLYEYGINVVSSTSQEFSEDPYVLGNINIETKPISISVDSTALVKKYDATREINLSEKLSLIGVVIPDDVNVDGIGYFNQAEAGNNISYLLSNFELTGNDSGNYSLTSAEIIGSSGEILRQDLIVKVNDQQKMTEFLSPALRLFIENGNVHHLESNGESIMIFTDTLRLAEISDYSEIVKFAEELEELI